MHALTGAIIVRVKDLRKTQGFLAKHKVETLHRWMLRRPPSKRRRLWLWSKGRRDLCKQGKQVIHLDLKKDKPGAETLKGLLLGRLGTSEPRRSARVARWSWALTRPPTRSS